MRRFLEQSLLDWKSASERRPLVLRGPRQVGKSYLIEQWLAPQFGRTSVINFEKNPDYKLAFRSSLAPRDVLSALEALGMPSVTPGQDLLFLDEIQACPEVITALRYFYEDLPQLHVVAAGSLLEFALGEASMPVGRVTYRYLGPLSFEEYLTAAGKQALVSLLRNHDFSQSLPEAHHHSLNNHLLKYLAVGGMPAVVKAHLGQQDSTQLELLLSDILTSYRDDIPKYATRRKELEQISLVLAKAPQLIGKQFKFVQLSREVRAQALRAAIDALAKAGVLSLCYSAHLSPLTASARLDRYKLFFLDIGLLQRALGLSIARWITEKESLVHTGKIAEQFIAQQIISASFSERKPLFFWERNKPSSSAEVDFLVERNDGLAAIEVKAGSSGSLKSLVQYKKEHPHAQAYKFSLDNFEASSNIHSIPLYAVGEWLRRGR